MCLKMQVQFIIVSIASWIRENAYYLLGIIISVLVASVFCSIWIKNNDFKDEKLSLQYEIQIINKSLLSEIRIFKDQNQKTIEQLQQVTEQKQDLRNENQKLIEKHQNLVEQNERLTEQTKNLMEQSKRFTEKTKKLMEQNERFTEQTKNLMEQNERLTEQTKNLTEQIKQSDDDHIVISYQVTYIERWITSINTLEDHMYHVIRYCQLMRKESEFYSNDKAKEEMIKLRHNIGYDVNEDDDDIIIPKAIEVIMKFKKECKKFLNALTYMNF